MDDKHPDLSGFEMDASRHQTQRDDRVAAKPDHVADLVERGLIQMVEDKPGLTEAGSGIIE